MTSPPDDRSPMAVAMSWVSRITAISVEMTLPGVLGFWLDGRLGTKVVFTLIGFALGMTLGMWHLLRMVGGDPPKQQPPDN